MATAGEVGGGQTGNPQMPAEEQVTVYSGEGRPAVITTTSRTETLIGEGPQTNITSTSEVVHYLRSSVLDAVIAELDAQGARTKEYIYAGGERIAEWAITPFNDAIHWQHKNPITGAWVSIMAGLNSAIRTEVDPSGRTTGNQPFTIFEDPPPASPTRQQPYVIEGGQTIEAELGMQLFEDRYINQVFGPGAGPDQGNYSGEAWRDWQTAREFQLMTGQRFLFGIDEMNANVPSSYEWVDQWEQWDDGSFPYQGDAGQWIVPSLRLVNRGYYRLLPSQKTPLTKDEIGVLESELTKLLSSKDCANFIESVLKQLKSDTGRSNYDTTSMLTLFDKVKTGRGFDWQPGLNGQARAGGGHDYKGENVASMSIKPINEFANLANKSPGFILNRGRTLAHELFHVAGYDHAAMALAAFKLEKRMVGWKAWSGTFPNPQDKFFKDDKTGELLDGAYAGFFSDVLNQHCK
jgi:hypothetical protein